MNCQVRITDRLSSRRDVTLTKPELLEAISPSQWGFDIITEGPVPSEFTYRSPDQDRGSRNTTSMQSFFADLKSCLKNHDLISIFGVELLPPSSPKDLQAGYEFTSGRSNITLGFQVRRDTQVDRVLWRFSPDPNVLYYCTRYCDAPTWPDGQHRTGHFMKT